jgi:hypothetical protein
VSYLDLYPIYFDIFFGIPSVIELVPEIAERVAYDACVPQMKNGAAPSNWDDAVFSIFGGGGNRRSGQNVIPSAVSGQFDRVRRTFDPQFYPHVDLTSEDYCQAAVY